MDRFAKLARGALRSALLAIGLICSLASAGHAENGLYICVGAMTSDAWKGPPILGSVLVPSGTVFDYAGHVMGSNLRDPKNSAHTTVGGWKEISQDEMQRRQLLLSGNILLHRHTRGVVTLVDVVLTESKPCVLAQANAVLSELWGWTVTSIVAERSEFYQVYGVVHRGALDISLASDTDPFKSLAAAGEINASVHGTISTSLDLDRWSASQPPDDAPVQGNGNSECWGDDGRQDISCRALTESFLLSMRGATKDQLQQAMNVKGREIRNGLHFISNYSKGQRWGSGDVNFTFDDEGKVSIITGSLDPPDGNGIFPEFIWNRELLPAGCSDLPDTRMKRCRDL